MPSTLAAGGSTRPPSVVATSSPDGATSRFAASKGADPSPSGDTPRPGIGGGADADRELSPALRAARVGGGTGTAPPSFPNRQPAASRPPTDPFPDWSKTAVGAAPSGDRTAAMAVPARERLAGGGTEGPAGRSGDRPARDATAGLGGSGARPGPRSASAQRLQDTELKLAGQRRRPKPKPKEPNRLVLGLALALVVAAGIAVAWWLTSGGDGGAEPGTDDATTASSVAPVDDTAVEDGAPVSDAPTESEPVVSEPTLFFDEAMLGPLDRETTYSIDLAGEPEGSLLQVVVDDIPQGEPAAGLPDLILPAGRHTIYIAITGAATANSTPVDVYVLGDPPPAGYLANLASVDVQNEGWAEALRRFDEFRAAGHENLQLLPLTDGYWNIYIGGLGDDQAAVETYCESFQLAVPDQCFAKPFDPADYTPPAPTTPGAGSDGAADATTDTSGGSDSTADPTGESTSTTAPGG